MIALLIGGYLQIESKDAKDLFLNMDALILRLRELGIVGALMAAQGTWPKLPVNLKVSFPFSCRSNFLD
ncbi:MAG: hypothetical protein E2O60_05875 [Gammaproteobacteria bacterium]|nr:MAG: hypothetical protein E2O60_05875 [Gammaproteobacteria bacterium]